MLGSVLVLAAAVTSVQAVDGDGWSYYGHAGPDQWSRLGFSHCTGRRQSPINVVTNRVVPRSFKPISLHDFDQVPLSMQLSNNHHTATAEMTWHQVPVVTGGGLTGQYEVANFHFHWGRDNFKGSEHTIDGESYPLEVHIVCRNSRYSELSEALLHLDGLAVLGVMYQVTNDSGAAMASLEVTNDSGAAMASLEVTNDSGAAMASLEGAIQNITAGGATITVPAPPPLRQLMPVQLAGFYRYNGSLTTPGCYEAVTWTVFTQPMAITTRQLGLFRALMRNPEPIGYNYRPTQRRYGRSVFLSSDTGLPRTPAARPPSRAAGTPPPLELLLSPLLLALLTAATALASSA